MLNSYHVNMLMMTIQSLSKWNKHDTKFLLWSTIYAWTQIARTYKAAPLCKVMVLHQKLAYVVLSLFCHETPQPVDNSIFKSLINTHTA